MLGHGLYAVKVLPALLTTVRVGGHGMDSEKLLHSSVEANGAPGLQPRRHRPGRPRPWVCVPQRPIVGTAQASTRISGTLALPNPTGGRMINPRLSWIKPELAVARWNA
jgi:hypothetical protein